MPSFSAAQNDGPIAVFEQPYWIEKPVIEALGRAQLELPPNRASFSVTFVETNRDAKLAMEASVARARFAYETIKAVTGETAIVSTSVQIEPYYEQYRDRDRDLVENRHPDKVRGYESRASLSVKVEEISKAGEARAAALALGPEDAGSLRVYLEETAEVTRLAYEAAVADAHARAEASARASNSVLGQVLVIQEGSGPCLGRWTTQTGRVRSDTYKSEAPPKSDNRMLQTITVTATKIGDEEIIITEDDIEALNLPSDQVPQTVNAQVCVVYEVGGR